MSDSERDSIAEYLENEEFEDRNHIQRFVIGEIEMGTASSSKRKNTSDGKDTLL